MFRMPGAPGLDDQEEVRQPIETVPVQHTSQVPDTSAPDLATESEAEASEKETGDKQPPDLDNPEVQAHLWDCWRRFKSLPQDDPERLALKRYLYKVYEPSMEENARSFTKRTIPRKSLVSEEDAVQVVRVRMWDEMENFDLKYGVPFQKFFNGSRNNRLRGAIRDETRSLMNFPRNIPKALRKYHGNLMKLRQKLRHDPTLEEYMDEYGWEDNIEDLTQPLLFAQVFNQSNTKPGEKVEEELRFEGDRRREQATPFVDAKQAQEQMHARIAMERRIMDLIPDRHCQLAVIAYWFWGWKLEKIGDAAGISTTLASKRRKQGEAFIYARYMEQGVTLQQARQKFLDFIQKARTMNGTTAVLRTEIKVEPITMSFDFS